MVARTRYRKQNASLIEEVGFSFHVVAHQWKGRAVGRGERGSEDEDMVLQETQARLYAAAHGVSSTGNVEVSTRFLPQLLPFSYIVHTFIPRSINI